LITVDAIDINNYQHAPVGVLLCNIVVLREALGAEVVPEWRVGPALSNGVGTASTDRIRKWHTAA